MTVYLTDHDCSLETRDGQVRISLSPDSANNLAMILEDHARKDTGWKSLSETILRATKELEVRHGR